MRHVGEAYGASIEEQGRTLSTRLAGDVAIHGDRQLLIQLFANLIENAQHTPEGSHIVLTLETDAGSALAQVTDDGPTAPADRAGEGVSAVPTASTKAARGERAWPGLSLSRAIADLHGAAIALHDNHPGLRVSLTFPAEVARGGPAA